MIKKLLFCLSLLFMHSFVVGQIQPYNFGPITEPDYHLDNDEKVFLMPFIQPSTADFSDAVETSWAYVLRGALESRYMVKYGKDSTQISRFSVSDLLDNVPFTGANLSNIAPAIGKNIFGKNNPNHAINYLTKSNANSCKEQGALDKRLYANGIINEGDDYCIDRTPVAYVTKLNMYNSPLGTGGGGESFMNDFVVSLKNNGAVFMSIPWNINYYISGTKLYNYDPSTLGTYPINFFLPVLVVGWKSTGVNSQLIVRSPFIDGDFFLETDDPDQFHFYYIDVDTIPSAVIHHDDFGPNYVTNATKLAVIYDGIRPTLPPLTAIGSDIEYDVTVKYTTPNSKLFRLNKVSLFAHTAKNIDVEIYESDGVTLLSKKIGTGTFTTKDSIPAYDNLSSRNTSYYTIDLDSSINVEGDFYIKARIKTEVGERPLGSPNIYISAGVGATAADVGKAWYSTNLSDPFENDFATTPTNDGFAKPTIRAHLDEPWLVEYSLKDNDILFLDTVPSLNTLVQIDNGRINYFDTIKLSILDPSNLPEVGNYDLVTTIVRANVAGLDTTNLYRTSTPDKQLRIRKRRIEIDMQTNLRQKVCSIDTSELFNLVDIKHKGVTSPSDSLRVKNIVLDSIYNNLWVKRDGWAARKFLDFATDTGSIWTNADYKVYLDRTTLDKNFDFVITTDTARIQFEKITTSILWSSNQDTIYVGSTNPQGIKLDASYLSGVVPLGINLAYSSANVGAATYTTTSDSIKINGKPTIADTLKVSLDLNRACYSADSTFNFIFLPKPNPVIEWPNVPLVVGDSVSLKDILKYKGTAITLNPSDYTFSVSNTSAIYDPVTEKLVIKDTAQFKLTVKVKESTTYDILDADTTYPARLRMVQHIDWNLQNDTVIYVGKNGLSIDSADILYAKASCGYPVDYSGCTLPGGKLVFNKPTSDSIVTIIASQQGDAAYRPASDSTKHLIIRPKMDPVITVSNLTGRNLGEVIDLSTIITITPSSAKTVTVSDLTKAYIDVAGKLVIIDTGNFNLVVNVAETDKHEEGTNFGNVQVLRFTQNITWPLQNDTVIYVGRSGVTIDSTDILYASASSTLDVSYSGITFTGGQLTLTKPASVLSMPITASQVGNNRFSSATDVIKTLKITPKINPDIVINPVLNKKPGDIIGIGTIISINPNLSFTPTISDPTKAEFDGSGNLVIKDTGDFTLTVVVPETAIYDYGTANKKIEIAPLAKQTQQINWSLQNDTIIYVGKNGLSMDSANILYATATSGLDVSYSGITLVSGKLVLTKPASVQSMPITAIQGGNNLYDPATNVVKTLKITPKKDPIIQIDPIDGKNPGDIIDLGTVITINPNLNYTVTVSNPAKAEIDGSGNLIIKDTGDFKLTVNVPETGQYEEGEGEVIVYGAGCTDFIVKWGHVLTCDNTGLIYKSYQWYRNNQILPGATKQYYKADKADINADFFVEATRHNGTVDIYCGKIKEEEIPVKSHKVLLYPNPAQAGSISTLSSGLEPSVLEKSILRIYTHNGQLVNSFKPSTDPNIEITMPTTAGVYIIKLTTPETEITLNAIVK